MKTLMLALLMSLTTLPAQAALLSFDFRAPSFNPGNTASFYAPLPGGPGVTFTAEGPEAKLYWDTEDGFGVRGGGSYSQDEIEGPETLKLTFDYPVVVGVLRLTDLFYENEFIVGGSPPCFINPWPTCYREQGSFSTNEGLTWTPFVADLTQNRWFSNGELIVPVGGVMTSLWLRAPGAVNVQGFPYTQLHEFSLAGIDVKTFPTAVPEPMTLLTLGTGLLYGVWRAKKPPMV